MVFNVPLPDMELLNKVTRKLSMTNLKMNRGKNILGLLCLTLTVSACGSGLSDAFSYKKNPPDEFAILKKQPLIIPPDYSLKPPNQAGSKIARASTRVEAEQILTGREVDISEISSDGEKEILDRVGSNPSQNNVRSKIQSDGNTVISKDKTITENLILNTTGE
ncbi:MAG TPA: hypothetical protein DCP14_05410 [Rhodobiaceae bacterium]|nr:hypothetical protein [Rhodobiaceae bacterium]